MSDLIDGLEKTEDKRGWLLSTLSLIGSILKITKGKDNPTLEDLNDITEEDLDKLSDEELNKFNEKYNNLKEGKC